MSLAVHSPEAASAFVVSPDVVRSEVFPARIRAQEQVHD